MRPRETAQLLRRAQATADRPGTKFFSSIYVPNAGRAMAASLAVPAGVYNVCEDVPISLVEYLRMAAECASARRMA